MLAAAQMAWHGRKRISNPNICATNPPKKQQERRRRTAAVQDASRDLAPCKFRQVLDCGCPSAAFGAADLVTDTFNRTPQATPTSIEPREAFGVRRIPALLTR